MTEFISEHITELGISALYFLASLVLFLIGKIAFQQFNRKINVTNELLEKDNLAFSFSLVGYYIGLTLAIGSALLGEGESLQANMISIGIYGLGAILLLNISSIINDKLIFRKFKMQKEITEDENVGSGVIEAANYVATGLIIFGASKGAVSFDIIILYWAIAQVALILSSVLYNIITPYDIHDEIEKDNVAVGVGFAGTIIGMAIILSYAVSNHYDSIPEASISIGTLIIIGLITLPLTRIVTDKVLLSGYSLTDELVNQQKPNIGCGLIEATAYIGASILLTWCF